MIWLFIITFSFINILGILVNIKGIEKHFNPSYILNVNRAWLGMWLMLTGSGIFSIIFFIIKRLSSLRIEDWQEKSARTTNKNS